MTILQTITGITLLMLGLGASVGFYRQIDCYHELSVVAVELRLKPTEYDENSILKINTKCSALLKRNNQIINIQYRLNSFVLNFPLDGKI